MASIGTRTTYQYALSHAVDTPGTAGVDEAANGEEAKAECVLPRIMPRCHGLGL